MAVDPVEKCNSADVKDGSVQGSGVTGGKGDVGLSEFGGDGGAMYGVFLVGVGRTDLRLDDGDAGEGG